MTFNESVLCDADIVIGGHGCINLNVLLRVRKIIDTHARNMKNGQHRCNPLATLTQNNKFTSVKAKLSSTPQGNVNNNT